MEAMSTPNNEDERLRRLEESLLAAEERSRQREERDRQDREERRKAMEALNAHTGGSVPPPPPRFEIPIEPLPEDPEPLRPWNWDMGPFPEEHEEEPTPEEREKIEEELVRIPEGDKEKLGWGLSVIGYRVEKLKDDLFAKALSGAAEKADKKGTFGRFVSELRESFVRDAKEAEEKGLDIQEGRNKGKFRQVGNVGKLTGNVLKYGRIVADVCGVSIANPFRYVMMGGMVTARAAEAGKEARFKSDALLEQTQIKDADEAAEEAWRIYEKADRARGFGATGAGNISAEELRNAYLTEMPKDIQERLKEDPTVTLNFVQKMMRKQIEFLLINLRTKLREVGESYNTIKNTWTPRLISPEQKRAEEMKILKKWEKKLKDYDRMITQYGTVDGLAMAARYAQTAGKTVVLGMQIETAYKSITNIPKLWEHLSHALSGSHNVSPEEAIKLAGLQKEHNLIVGYRETIENGQKISIETLKDGQTAKIFPDGHYKMYAPDGKYIEGKDGIIDTSEAKVLGISEESIRLGMVKSAGFTETTENGQKVWVGKWEGGIRKFYENGEVKIFNEKGELTNTHLMSEENAKSWNNDGLNIKPSAPAPTEPTPAPQEPQPAPAEPAPATPPRETPVERPAASAPAETPQSQPAATPRETPAPTTPAETEHPAPTTHEVAQEMPPTPRTVVNLPDGTKEYFEDGKLVETRLPDGTVEHYNPDNGELLNKKFPDGHTDLYDNKGKVIMRTDINGQDMPIGETPVSSEEFARLEKLSEYNFKETVENGHKVWIGPNKEGTTDIRKVFENGRVETFDKDGKFLGPGMVRKEDLDAWNDRGFQIKLDENTASPITENTPTEPEIHKAPSVSMEDTSRPTLQHTPERAAETIPDNRHVDVEEATRRVHESYGGSGKIVTGSEMRTGGQPNSMKLSGSQLDNYMRTGHIVTSQGEVGSNIIYNSNPQNIHLFDEQNARFPELTPRANLILQSHPEFGKNPFHLSGERLMQVYQTHERNITQIFSHHDNGMDAWSDMKGLKAADILGRKEYSSDDKLMAYLQKLQTITKLRPKGIIRRETVEQYIARAEQYAAKVGKLSQLKVE